GCNPNYVNVVISSMTAIIKFLDDECDGFNYERDYRPYNTNWCE
uniref:Kringle domain-containing protein n=1 Tax=Meloidogyne hapla TaxID=6305 RepID=A0A1I8BXH4_MELHA